MAEAKTKLSEFFRHPTAGGICLIMAMVLALCTMNSGLKDHYVHLLHHKVGMTIGPMSIIHSIELWINDGLMVIFFLLVGMEIKREIINGELSTRSQRILPCISALGGMAVPAVIFLYVAYENQTALRGWAIPSATDIAFSLGILSLLGPRVPVTLKVFLTALAIIDDLGAIAIIALFYTETLNSWFLLSSSVLVVGLFAMLRFRVKRLTPYMLLGFFLWFCVFKSGVHATIAGVILGFSIPHDNSGNSPLQRLEHILHPWVIFLILPIFAFANSGIDLSSVSSQLLFSEVSIGIASGLFFGKQIGIFLSAFLVIALGFSKLPEGASWRQLYGVAILGGIGFTMSLFIGTLAYRADDFFIETRLGVIAGSTFSALFGYFILLKPRTR